MYQIHLRTLHVKRNQTVTYRSDRANAVQVVSIQLHVRALLPQSGAGGPGIGGVSQRPTAARHYSFLLHVQRQRHWERPAAQRGAVSGSHRPERLMGALQKVKASVSLCHSYQGSSDEAGRWGESDGVSRFPSEPDSSRLLRSGGFRIKPSTKTTMVLMQDNLEDHTSLAGGGNGRRGDRGVALQRRAGSSGMQGSFSKQHRHFTARIVAMGDDRILGRLAKEYYFFRWGAWRRCRH